MGYNIVLSGSIEVEPRLPDAFVEALNRVAFPGRRLRRQAEHLPTGDAGGVALIEGPPVQLAPVHFELSPWMLDNCVLAGRTLIRQPYDSVRAYDFESWLDALVTLIREHYPESTFSGAVEWEGEDPVDRGWIAVSDNRVIEFRPDTLFDIPSEAFDDLLAMPGGETRIPSGLGERPAQLTVLLAALDALRRINRAAERSLLR